MKQVLKWTVPVDDRPHEIGSGPVVLVSSQYGPEAVQVWTEEESRTEDTVFHGRQAQVIGTGQEIPDGLPFHVGSVALNDITIVWHVYADAEKNPSSREEN